MHNIDKSLFDFEENVYQVLSTQIQCTGLFAWFSSEKHDTVYYIRQVSKRSRTMWKDKFLVKYFNEYRFVEDYLIGELYRYKIVYWNNFQEPANLITRMKSQDSDSIVLFSSDDIP